MVELAKGNSCFQGFGDFPKGHCVKNGKKSIHHNPPNFPQRKARWMCSYFPKASDICSLSLRSINCW